jgi:DNA-binding response OmpR family regulator
MKARIALVEDDEDLCASICDYLLASGYQVWSVNSAEAFYRQLIVNSVDIVLLDIGLPGEDGLSLLKHLNMIDQNHTFEIIMLTASCNHHDKVLSLNCGANRFLSKPVNMEELIANIDAVFRAKFKQALTIKKSNTTKNNQKNCWTLIPTLQTLSTPEGLQIKLTHNENLLLFCLAEHKGTCHREDISVLLNQLPSTHDYARMDVMLSRLRKKVYEQTNTILPLNAIPTNCLKFSDDLVITQ